MIANEYGFYSKPDMADRLHGDIAHFAKKHGCIPDTVIIHPENLPEAECITIEGGGRTYEVRFVGDYRQLRSTYTIARVSDGER